MTHSPTVEASDETGTLNGFAKITRDISERRRNEERLWHLARSRRAAGTAAR
jgi:hypothetical protein